MHMGPDFVLVNISLKFSPSTDADTIEKTIDFMEDQIKQSYPNVKRVFTEVEAGYSLKRH
jgi:divalent metal cation (Fe/Co/Zn/Cd) transporter